MDKILEINDKGQEIGFSDLDDELEVKVVTKDIDDRKTIIWLCKENIISIRDHLNYLIDKF